MAEGEVMGVEEGGQKQLQQVDLTLVSSSFLTLPG